MEGLRISAFSLVSENENGSTFLFPLAYSGEAILGWRKKASVSGRHYHMGNASTKNPEVLLLVHGEATLCARDLNTGTEEIHHLVSPLRIEIFPYLWHEITALTDICFLELNSLDEHKSDTFYLD